MADDIISVYTRQNAIDDSMFKDVTEMAKEAGFKIPVAVTSNLYHTHINPNPMPQGQDEKGRLWDVLSILRLKAAHSKSSMVEFDVLFRTDLGNSETVRIWAVIEAQSPTDPSPAINIMLPEDY